MIVVGICDGEQTVRSLVASFVARYRSETDMEIQLLSYSTGEKLLKNYLLDIDLIFLEIPLRKVSGLKIAKHMLFIDFAFLDDRAPRFDFPILSGDFFLGAYSLAGFVVEHAAAGDLDIRLREQCPFTEYQVYVVVGLAFVVVECANAFYTVPLVKFL